MQAHASKLVRQPRDLDRKALVRPRKLVCVSLLRQTQHGKPEHVEGDAGRARLARRTGGRRECRVDRKSVEKGHDDTGEKLRCHSGMEIEYGEQARDRFRRNLTSSCRGTSCRGAHCLSAVRVELQENADFTALQLSFHPTPECVDSQRIVSALICLEGLALACNEAGDKVLDEFGEERVLIVKVVVNQSLAHTGIHRDILNGQRGSARSGYSTRCRLQNSPRGGSRLATRSARHARESYSSARSPGAGAFTV